MTGEELQALWISLKVAVTATALAAAPGVAAGWWLARSRSRWRAIVEALVMLPLLLPPVATGVVVLVVIAHAIPDLALTWPAAALATAIIILPLVAQSVRTGVEGVDPGLEGIARTLGASGFRVMRTVTLPLAWRGIATGLMLAGCKALGEFGATIVVAGNIPGKTQTLALLMFNLAETARLGEAMRVLAIAALLSLAIATAAVWIRSKRGTSA